MNKKVNFKKINKIKIIFINKFNFNKIMKNIKLKVKNL